MSTQIQLPVLERNLEVTNFGAERIKEYRQAQLERRLYSITNRLLATLEVDQCVEIFMQAVAEDLLFDGFHYSLAYPEPAINLHFGRQSRHKCSYSLNIEDVVLGELTVYRGRRFSETELKHLEKLLCVLVQPLRNAIQYRKAVLMSQLDALTGLHNRAAYDRDIERELSLAERHKLPLSLMLLDIDFFKKVNDVYGHAAGDQVLRAVANALKDATRSSDVVFRYGGEEFAILLSDVDSLTAMDVAERIRLSVRGLLVEYDEQLINISVSIGMGSYCYGEGSDSLFKRTDEALYRAKNMGRDQVKIAAE
ncbi:MAG: GGDEF domain-containing protein [Gammaproteobacteria bacterium]|nr:GGDEF domain-containing protein [Gammaproteobacteria bacterium]